MPSEALCLGCANIFPLPRGRFVTCPECGFSVGQGRYKRLIAHSHEMARYGYDYRTAYEEELKVDPQGSRHFCLVETEKVLIFCAAAVASGVIGNAAYDLVKCAVKKIYSQLSVLSPNKKRVPTLLDDKLFEEFSRCIEQYIRGLEGVDKRVVSCIREEILVEKMTETDLKFLSAKTTDQLFASYSHSKSLNRTIRALKGRPRLKKEDFNKAWSQLELPGVHQISQENCLGPE